MVNAPPTPPPTTAAELRDEARGPSAGTTSLMSTSDLRQDVYQQNFPVIADFASKGDLKDLISTAEEVDLNAVGECSTSRLLIISPLVLAYLIGDNLPQARQCLKRLPDNLASLPLSKALNNMLTFTTNRQYSKIYSHAQEMYNYVCQGDFFDKSLGSVLSDMITSFVGAFRQRTLALLLKAYVSLPIQLACDYLGFTTEEIIDVAKRNSWGYDSSAGIFIPNVNTTVTSSASKSSAGIFIP